MASIIMGIAPLDRSPHFSSRSVITDTEGEYGIRWETFISGRVLSGEARLEELPCSIDGVIALRSVWVFSRRDVMSHSVFQAEDSLAALQIARWADPGVLVKDEDYDDLYAGDTGEWKGFVVHGWDGATQPEPDTD